MTTPASATEFFAAYAAVVGPICLSAITEGQARVPTRTFTDARAAAKWIAAHNGDANCYFIPNKVARPLGKKASRNDIGEIVAAHCDLDPVKGLDLAAERTRIKASIDALAPPPSMVIDSGGGFQIFWFFDAPLPPARHDEAEALNRAIAATLGGDRAATPISNLMRVPFTKNFPNAAKRKVRRVERRSELVAMDTERRYSFEALRTRWPGATTKGNGVDDAPPEFMRSHAASGRGLSGDAHDNPEPATREKIERAMAVVPNADLDWYDWTRIGLALFASLGDGGFAVFEAFSKKSEKYVEADTAARWREIKNSPPDRIGAGTIFFLADAADPSWRDDKPREEPQPSAPVILKWIDMATWDSEPAPPREWSIPGRVPRRHAGIFSGEGGVGKSIVEMQKNVAHVIGAEWLGSHPTRGPAFYIGAEDEATEFHRRFAAIAEFYGVTFKQLIDGGLMALCKLGEDAVLCAATGKSGKVETTEFYAQLFEAAGDIKPINISLDTLSRVAAINELDRTQVYGLFMHLQALALVANGSVTVLSHPSLSGIASGSGLSGSTRWHGAPRFRQYLRSARVSEDQPETDLRELTFKKVQYGPEVESIALRWQRGLFLPVSMNALDQAVAEGETDALFLELLDQFTAQGRNLSHVKQAQSYAPALFAKAAPGKRKTAFEGAMERLFATGRIKVETYGKPSRQYTRLVRA